MTTLKGPGAPLRFDGTPLRIAIVHARWNAPIIDALLAGCTSALLAQGVLASNIVTESVPGSYELPFAVQQLASQKPSSFSTSVPTTASDASGAFDAVIAIGVLIKGETMHFEYIADAVSHGLMRVQLDSGVPVVFGLLTVLTEEQALVRAGVRGGGHNHGEDWGAAAVELGVKRRGWRGV
ncbi:hypothetical protein MMC34_003627 [Xylographa carneopallida]|nr:hypothetical protein [Xylographa carneopallida]